MVDEETALQAVCPRLHDTLAIEAIRNFVAFLGELFGMLQVDPLSQERLPGILFFGNISLSPSIKPIGEEAVSSQEEGLWLK